MTDDATVYTRLEELVARLGCELTAPDGWQAAVLVAASHGRRRRCGGWWSGAALMLGAAIGAIAVRALAPGAPGAPVAPVGPGAPGAPVGPVAPVASAADRPLALTIARRDRDAPRVRGAEAMVRAGEPLAIEVRAHAAVRRLVIYGDTDALVLVCPGAADCRDTGDATLVVFTPPRAGRYTVVALSSARPLPAPTGGLDADAAAAVRAGASVDARALHAW